MPKPINETIGRCACSTPGCDEHAAVRKMRGNGRLYLVCRECGTIRPTGERFQNYILENAAMDGPGVPEPEPEHVQEPGPVEPEPAKPPAPAVPAHGPESGPGFWTDGNNEFEAFIKG